SNTTFLLQYLSQALTLRQRLKLVITKRFRFRSSPVACAAIFARRYSHNPLERLVKRAVRIIPNRVRYLSQLAIAFPEQHGRPVAPPPRQITERRLPHHFPKAQREGRSRHPRRRSQFAHRPRLFNLLVHRSQHSADSRVRQRAQPARLTTRARRNVLTDELEQKNIR